MMRVLIAVCSLIMALPTSAQKWDVSGDYRQCTASRGNTVALTWSLSDGHELLVSSALLLQRITPIGTRPAKIVIAFDVPPDDLTSLPRPTDWTSEARIFPSEAEASFLQPVSEKFITQFAAARQMLVSIDGELAVVASLSGSSDAVGRLQTCVRQIRGDQQF